MTVLSRTVRYRPSGESLATLAKNPATRHLWPWKFETNGVDTRLSKKSSIYIAVVPCLSRALWVSANCLSFRNAASCRCVATAMVWQPERAVRTIAHSMHATHSVILVTATNASLRCQIARKCAIDTAVCRSKRERKKNHLRKELTSSPQLENCWPGGANFLQYLLTEGSRDRRVEIMRR